MITVAIGTDHRGYELKEHLIAMRSIGEFEISWLDFGTDSNERTDYPLYVLPVCEAVLDNRADYGVLLCGSGIGMSIAANRFVGIRAGLIWNEQVARQAKADDDVNVLVLPADFISEDLAEVILRKSLGTTFRGGRYAERIKLIDKNS